MKILIYVIGMVRFFIDTLNINTIILKTMKHFKIKLIVHKYSYLLE